MPLHSTDSEVRVSLLVVKRTKEHRLFLQHLGLPCPDSSTIYEDNTSVMTLVKDNIITNRLLHSDVPLFYMHNESNLQNFNIGHCPSNLMITNFVKKISFSNSTKGNQFYYGPYASSYNACKTLQTSHIKKTD